MTNHTFSKGESYEYCSGPSHTQSRASVVVCLLNCSASSPGHADTVSWLRCGVPVGRRPHINAYQRSFGLLVSFGHACHWCSANNRRLTAYIFPHETSRAEQTTESQQHIGTRDTYRVRFTRGTLYCIRPLIPKLGTPEDNTTRSAKVTRRSSSTRLRVRVGASLFFPTFPAKFHDSMFSCLHPELQSSLA